MLPGEHLLWSSLLSIHHHVWRDMTAAWDCQLLEQAVWLNLVFLSDQQGVYTIMIVYLRRRPVWYLRQLLLPALGCYGNNIKLSAGGLFLALPSKHSPSRTTESAVELSAMVVARVGDEWSRLLL